MAVFQHEIPCRSTFPRFKTNIPVSQSVEFKKSQLTVSNYPHSLQPAMANSDGLVDRAICQDGKEP